MLMDKPKFEENTPTDATMPSTGPTSKHPATPVITPALIAVPIRKECW